MKFLKKINELFDSDELKDKFEIPYLKGEISKDISNWEEYKNISKLDENSLSFYAKCIYRYPILRSFREKMIIINDTELYALYATSVEDEPKYYVQIGFYYYENKYNISVILRDKRYEDDKDWIKEQYQSENIDSMFNVIENFLSSCEDLNVMTKHQKFNIKNN